MCKCVAISSTVMILTGLLALNLGVCGPWVSVLRLEVVVRHLLPLLGHSLWRWWSQCSNTKEDGHADSETNKDTSGNLTSLTLWVNRTTWTPGTVRDVPGSLLLRLGQFRPWELLTLSELRNNLLLVVSWKGLPSLLELSDGGVGNWVSRGESCLTSDSGSGDVSGSGSAEHGDGFVCLKGRY